MEQNEIVDKINTLETDKQTFDTEIDSIKIDDNTNISIQNEIENKPIEEINKKEILTQKKEIKKEDKKSDLSYYIEVPDIINNVKKCNKQVLSTVDSFNLLGIFVLTLITFIFRTKLKTTIDKLLLKIKKYSFLIILLNFILTIIIFSYSDIVGTGIPGKLPYIIKIKFLILLYISSLGIISFFITYLNKHKNILDKPVFPGMNFLTKSLIIFNLISNALFIFTESFIAFLIVFILNLLLNIFIIRTKLKNFILNYNDCFINYTIVLQFIFIFILLNLSLLVLLFSFIFVYMLNKDNIYLKKIFIRE